MDDPQRQLEERFGFDDWRGANRLSGDLFVAGFFFGGGEVPGWDLGTAQDVPAPDDRRVLQAVFAMDQSLVLVTTVEGSSRDDAHRAALELLGDFQSPEVRRQEDSTLGDVAFGDGSDRFVLFVRANVVHLIRNGGDELVDVSPIGAALDEVISRRDEPDEDRVAPRFERFTGPKQVGTNEPGALDLAATDPIGRPVWFKLFTEGGQVQRRDGQLVFVPDRPGAHEVTAIALNAGFGAAVMRTTIFAG